MREPTLDVEYLPPPKRARYLRRWHAVVLEMANDGVRPASLAAMRERYEFGLCTIEELEAAADLDARLPRGS